MNKQMTIVTKMAVTTNGVTLQTLALTARLAYTAKISDTEIAPRRDGLIGTDGMAHVEGYLCRALHPLHYRASLGHNLPLGVEIRCSRDRRRCLGLLDDHSRYTPSLWRAVAQVLTLAPCRRQWGVIGEGLGLEE